MATYYFRNTGDANWGTSTNWSLIDGGGSTGAVPTSSDDAVFTNNSGSCTLNSTNRVCKSLTCTSYTNTLTFSNNLTVSGNITLGASMSFAGSAQLICNATATVTSNGKSIDVLFSTSSNSSIIITLADDLTLNVGYTKAAAGLHTFNGNTIYITGNISIAGSSTTGITGTSVIVYNGTGNWTGTGGLRNTFDINTSGTLTIGDVNKNTGTLTYIAGTVIFTGTISTGNNTTSWDIDGLTVNNISFGVGIHTLISDMTVAGTLSMGTSLGSSTINGNNLYTSGNVVIGSIASGNAGGTTSLIISGTATISSTLGAYLAMNTTITSSNISGTLIYGGSGANALHFTAQPSIDLQIKLSSNLDIGGYYVNSLTITVSNPTITLISDMIIISSFTNTTSTAASKASFVSDTPGTQRKLTLGSGATQDIGFTNFTDIDASDGATIWVWKPTLSNTANINSLTYPKTISKIQLK